MKLEINSQGFYRVRLPNGRILNNTDLMSAILGSTRTTEMIYGTKASAIKGYAYYEELRARTGRQFSEVTIIDDFKPEN
jgi:hypothetical protein